MIDIISPFQMERNKVIAFNLTQNDNLSECGSVSIRLSADYKISDINVEEEKYSARLDLFINLVGITEQEEQVFDIRLDMSGDFQGNRKMLDKSKFGELLKINGVSTLMQLSRAYITSATALSGFDRPINFPMINIFDLNRLKEEAKEKE